MVADPFRHGMGLGDVNIWGFPKIWGTFLGVPIIATIVYLGLYWGPPILGKYHMEFLKKGGP